MKLFSRTDTKASATGSAVAQFTVGQPVWTKRDLSQFAEEGYRKNVIAYRSISLIASSLASVPFLLYKGEKELEQHPLLNVLARPNPNQGGAQLIEALVSYYLITGNSYLEVVRGLDKKSPPRELWPLRPDRLRVVPAGNGMIQRYEYTVNGVTVKYPCDPVTGQGNLLHLKHFSMIDDWYGMSPLEAAAYAVDQHNQAGAWNQALLQNGASPSGAFIFKAERSKEEKNRLWQAIEDRYTGAKNVGKPLMLFGDGADYKEMGLSPKDMDFVNAKHTSARDIALAFGVPPQLLGIPGDNTYSNMAEARLALWEDTIIPLMDKMIDALNNWLVPMFGDDSLLLGYDADEIPALVLRRQEKQKSITELWDRKLLTRNQTLEALGWGKQPDGDVYKDDIFDFGFDAPKSMEKKDWVPSNIVEVSQELDDPTVRAKATGLVEDILRDLISELGSDMVQEIGVRSAFDNSTRAQNYIKLRAADLMEKVNKTTRELIRKQLAEGFDAGENIEQLTQRVGRVFKEAGAVRARRIATTESTRAAGFSSEEAIRQAGLNAKEWVSTQDEATRDSHRSLDGQVVEVDGKFRTDSGAEADYPGGFNDPAEDINCRCAVMASFGKSNKSLSPEERKAVWQAREMKRMGAERRFAPVMLKVFALQYEAMQKRIIQMSERVEVSGPQIGR